MERADLLLNPVRLRIVKAFLADRALTTSQLAAELDDVPTGSLYRHVAMLVTAGVLHIVSERRVRGAVERTYMLRQAAARIQPAEAASMTPDEHADAFIRYVAGLLADFGRYLATNPIDPVRDGADYRVGALWLTDSEYHDLVHDLMSTFAPRAANAPAKGRRRRLIYTVFLPGTDQPNEAESARPRHRRTDGSR